MGSCSSQHVPEAQRGGKVRLVTGRLRPGRVMRLPRSKSTEAPWAKARVRVRVRGWWHCCREVSGYVALCSCADTSVSCLSCGECQRLSK